MASGAWPKSVAQVGAMLSVEVLRCLFCAESAPASRSGARTTDGHRGARGTLDDCFRSPTEERPVSR